MSFTRDELQALRSKAGVEADASADPAAKRAYFSLFDSADRIDAMFARAAAVSVPPPPPPPPPPVVKSATKLIYAGWFGVAPSWALPTPQFIRDNAAFLDSQPFDGLAVYLRRPDTTDNLTVGVQGAPLVSYDLAMDVLAPIRGLGPAQNLKHNFAVVMGGAPPDFFDPWDAVISDWANLARACKDSGLVGIMFDNEQYFGPWGDFQPGAMKYPVKTLGEYQAQARIRGRQIVNAVELVFPGCAILTLHGPYVSEPKAPPALLYPQWQTGNELLGPFFAGMIEAADLATTKIVDGSEIYNLRTAAQFKAVYDWSKTTLPTVSSFITPTIAAAWPQRVSIGFGIYDIPWGGADMNPAILAPTITNALKQADHYVWFYAEGQTFLLPPSAAGGASQAWVDATRQGRLAAS